MEDKHHHRRHSHHHAGEHHKHSVQHHPGSAFKTVQPNGSGSGGGAGVQRAPGLYSGGSGIDLLRSPDGCVGIGSVEDASCSGRRVENPLSGPNNQAKQQLHQQVLQQLQILGSQQQNATAGSGQGMLAHHHQQQQFGGHVMHMTQLQDVKQEISGEHTQVGLLLAF